MWYYVCNSLMEGVALKKKSTVLINMLKNSCVTFTVIVLALYSAGMAFSTEEQKWIPTFTMVWMVLVFSLMLNLAGLLMKIERLNLAVRVILHYITIAVVFYIVFLLWGGYGDKGSLIIGLMLIFTVVYAVAMAITLCIKKPWRKREQKAADYKSMLG